MAEFWESDSVATSDSDWWKQDAVKSSTSTVTTPAADSGPPTLRDSPSEIDRKLAERKSYGPPGVIVPTEPSMDIADDVRTGFTGRMVEEAQKGLVPFTKLAPTAQEVQDAFDVLKAANVAGVASPGTPSLQTQLEGPSTPPSTEAKVIAGAVQAGLTVPETFTSPLGIATLGTGALGATGARVASGAFSADMLRHTPEQVVDVYEAIKLELGPEEATRRIGALTLNAAMVAATAKHAATAPKTPGEVAPLEVAAIKAEAAGAPATAEAVRAQAGAVDINPVRENGARTSLVLPDGTAIVGGRFHGETFQSAIEKGLASNDDLLRSTAAFTRPDGTSWDLQGKSVTIKSVVNLGDYESTTEIQKGAGEAPQSIDQIREAESQIKVPGGREELPDVQEKLISPPAATPAGAPPVVDVTAKPSATRTPEAAAVEALTPSPKWTIATESRQPLSLKDLAEGKRPPGAGQAGAINLAAITPAVKRAAKAVADTTKEVLSDFHIQPLNDRRRAVLGWSAKLQQSFGEADSAQRDIRKQVPDAAQRDGITNWIQAGGDAAVLAQRAAATVDPVLKAGYEAAMNLTPEALAVARDVKLAYDTLGQRGRRSGVLNSFVDNYVTQIWNLREGPAMGSSRTLKDQFRFNKARTFDTFFDGEQAGYTPKTKDISQLLPVYLHEMNSVIAARQLVAQMGDGVASDGRPLTAPSGNSRVVDGADGRAVLVTPKTIKGDTQDYKRMENQPALNDWVWAGKDTDGKPIFLKSDLKLHPEAYAQLKNALGRSAIKEWYDTRTSLMAAIPKAIVKGIDVTQTETKKTMLGFFAPFHQVQEGWHGVGHRVNPVRAKVGALPEPLKMPKIDLVNDPAQMDAARHGLMLLPDRVSANNFMEGFRTSGLVSRIPGIGKAADWYSHHLFHEYIPGLKFKTYEAIVERNTKVYRKELANGEVSSADVKALSASQANAAYGHLNYADLGRNPTIQHLMRLGLLAPDFLEARARFFGQALKGIGGAKVGREQLLALATLAIVQAALAYTVAKLTDGEWDGSSPFEFTKDGRRYTMRSVPEDFVSLMHDIQHVFEKGGETPFISHRLSPLVGRGGMQLLSGRDYRGRQVTPLQTAGELAKTPIPLTLRGAAGELPWVGDMLKPNTSLSIPEQLWSAVGIKISVDRPVKPEKPKHEKPKYKP